MKTAKWANTKSEIFRVLKSPPRERLSYNACWSSRCRPNRVGNINCAYAQGGPAKEPRGASERGPSAVQERGPGSDSRASERSGAGEKGSSGPSEKSEGSKARASEKSSRPRERSLHCSSCYSPVLATICASGLLWDGLSSPSVGRSDKRAYSGPSSVSPTAARPAEAPAGASGAACATEPPNSVSIRVFSVLQKVGTTPSVRDAVHAAHHLVGHY